MSLDGEPLCYVFGLTWSGRFYYLLIGCDYDTRMLIRMTIDEVNGTIQGAAYPFSLPE